MTWKPESNLIERIKELYTECWDDRFGIAQEDLSVGELIAELESEGLTDYANHLKSRGIPSDERVDKRNLYFRDVPDEMIKGTPIGVLMYATLAPHLVDCCIPENDNK